MSKISDALNNQSNTRVSSGLDATAPHMSLPYSSNEGVIPEQREWSSVKQGQEIVKHPKHYKSRVSKERMDAIIKRINDRGYLEAIDVIDAWNLNFNLGSAMKYVLRLSLKDSEITELEKAIEYLKFETEMRKADIAK